MINLITILAVSFMQQIAEYRADFLSGEHSKIIVAMASIGGIGASISVLKISGEMMRGKELHLGEILKPIILAIFILNFNLMVAKPLDAIFGNITEAIKTIDTKAQNDYEGERVKIRERLRKEEDDTKDEIEGISFSSNERNSSFLDYMSIFSPTIGRFYDIFTSQDPTEYRMKSIKRMGNIMTDIFGWIVDLSANIISGASMIFLMILAIVGPLVFSLALVPFFSEGISQWIARYIQISMWPAIVHIIKYVYFKLMGVVATGYVADADTHPFIVFFMVSGIALYCLFKTPTIAGWIVQSAGTGGVHKAGGAVATMIARTFIKV